MAKLTATGLRGLLDQPGRHPDGDGLYFRVTKTGTSSWSNESSSTATAGTSAWASIPKPAWARPAPSTPGVFAARRFYA